MLVLEYKAVIKKVQSKAIDEAIRTSQFVRNKVLRYWMDNHGVGKKELYQYNTQLRGEYEFVRNLSSHACQASVENVERAINRFFANCKAKKPGKKTPLARMPGNPSKAVGNYTVRPYSAIPNSKSIVALLNISNSLGSYTRPNAE